MVEIRHIPVLLQETIDGLCLKPGDTVVDGTLGSGGHSLEILKKILPEGCLIAMDMDRMAIDRFQKRIEGMTWAKQALKEGKIQIFHRNFTEMSAVLDELGVDTVSGVLVDLGFSSDQMDTAERGLSFSQDGPLDMRLNQEQSLTASQIVNTYPEEQLIKIFKEYSEERFAWNIAQAILKARTQEKIETTKALASIVEQVIPKRYRSTKIHPATKTFQALRMEVNQEIPNVKALLPQAIERLKSGGRCVVIAFHSGEDRIVKQFFQENARGCICPKDFPICRCGKSPVIRKITIKPTMPSENEVKNNPRSRSAKLRIIEKM